MYNMETFYKYTSFERAHYMLRNKCLPLGHISNSNDPYITTWILWKFINV